MTRRFYILVCFLAAACGGSTEKPNDRPSDGGSADTKSEPDIRTDAADAGKDASGQSGCWSGRTCGAVGETCGYPADACYTSCVCSASLVWECTSRCPGDDCVPSVYERGDCISQCRCVPDVANIGATIQECAENCGVAKQCAIAGRFAPCNLPPDVACNFLGDLNYQRPMCLCSASGDGGPDAGDGGPDAGGSWRCNSTLGAGQCGGAGSGPTCPGETCPFWNQFGGALCTCEGTVDGGTNTRWSCVEVDSGT